MPSLYLPNSVARELRERTRSFYEDVMRSIEIENGDALLLEFNEKLRRIDPRLLMVRAREDVVPGVPMRPGYYHLLRDNSDTGAPLSVTVIEGEDGRFVEPTSRVFENLAAGDMRERRNLERWAQTQRAEELANDREQQQNRDERRGHLKELVNAYTRTSVAGVGAGAWRQNQAGHEHGGKKP